MYAFKVVTTVLILISVVLLNVAEIVHKGDENIGGRLAITGVYTAIQAMAVISIWF